MTRPVFLGRHRGAPHWVGWRLGSLMAGLVLLLSGAAATAQAAPEVHRVLTALPAVHALTQTLSEGTSLRVVRVPSDAAAPMADQANALSHVDPAVFQQAEAVVTLSSLWRGDALYATARRHHLRIVEIDASRSWDSTRPSVAVMKTPPNDVPWAATDADDGGLSPYAWLGPVNAMRMAALIAADLGRLSPPDRARIERNLAALDTRLRRLKAEVGARLATVSDPRVLSLSNAFVYLFSEMGLFVDGWFVRQDIDWTAADCAALSRHLREQGIRVVVHQWQPDEKIVRAIAEGGARLVVLDVGDPGALADPTPPLDALLHANTDALLAALAAPGTGPSRGPLPR